MNIIFETIKNTPLFREIAVNDFEALLNCLSAKITAYKKNEIILLSGESINFVGVILSGGAKIIKEDINGHSSILTELAVSDIFCEVFACAGIAQSPVTIQATYNAEILYIDYKKVITACSAACPFHAALIKNMLQTIAEKNLMLNQKIEILSKRTTREKLLCYFDAHRGTKTKFTIPYNREELAGYLCVDRSAMSNELCKMRDDGLIEFKKNTFEML